MTQQPLRPIITTDEEEFMELLLEFWLKGKVPSYLVKFDFDFMTVDVHYGHC